MKGSPINPAWPVHSWADESIVASDMDMSWHLLDELPTSAVDQDSGGLEDVELMEGGCRPFNKVGAAMQRAPSKMRRGRVSG